MFPRHVEPLLAEALADTPVVLLNGARQTGKSTLVQALAARDGRRYLTLDDRVVLAAARNDPTGFIAALSGPVVMDEIQRAPELFLDIKAAVDRDRTPGRFLLTGSANVLLLPALADSLAGRMETLALWPLSSAEQAHDAGHNRAEALFDGDLTAGPRSAYDRGQLATILLQGGFPEAVARNTLRRRASWFESYVDTILQRDVRAIAAEKLPVITTSVTPSMASIRVRISLWVSLKQFSTCMFVIPRTGGQPLATKATPRSPAFFAVSSMPDSKAPARLSPQRTSVRSAAKAPNSQDWNPSGPSWPQSMRTSRPST